MKKILFIVAFLVGSTAWGVISPEIPDPDMTPGDLCDTRDADFKEYRYSERIPYCERNVTRERKTQIYLDYRVQLKDRRNYTIDHFIPLSMGGDNSDENLWPEHKKIKELRKHLEYDTYVALREGEITQGEAIEIVIEAKLNPPLEISVFEDILY